MNQTTADGGAAVPQVDPAEIDGMVGAGTLVIDVRGVEDHEKASVPGSVNIPLDDLPARAGSAIRDRDAPVVCYCNGGSRGPRAAAELQRMGYTNVAVIAGGLRGYLALKGG